MRQLPHLLAPMLEVRQHHIPDSLSTLGGSNLSTAEDVLAQDVERSTVLAHLGHLADRGRDLTVNVGAAAHLAAGERLV